MIRNKLWGLALAITCTFSTFTAADSVNLNSDHPDRYTVVKGDTLWGISERFLQDPWRWPDVWHVNQHIQNPHLIYPGDEIELTYVDGEPQLNLKRSNSTRTTKPGGTVRLSPRIRESNLAQAIPTIPMDAIRQFLLHPEVVNKHEMEEAPYVVAFPEDRLAVGAGDSIYVRSIDSKKNPNFTVFREGEALVDPETKEILGYDAKYVGDAQLKKIGDPATLYLSKTSSEVSIGDRLKEATDQHYDSHFTPRPPKTDINGHIILVTNGVSRIGQYNTVVLSRGREDGLEAGHVLNIWQAGNLVHDYVSDNPRETVKLPDEKAGYLMVYKTFDRVSYALVMRAEKEISVGDVVKTP
jgi:hypothetical protein